MKDKTKQNQIIEKMFNSCTKKEAGVTLVALIVAIVIMVIIAAVSIMAVYNSRIVEYGINGTIDYATEGINENKVLEGTEKLIESAVDNIRKLGESSEPEESKPEEPTLPEPTGLTKEELSQDTMIGRYVDYKPQGADYPVDGTYSGTGENQTFEKNENMKWRIWGVEENKLLLISETLAGNIQLQGANGYNNAVKILNDACSTAFGNSSYGEVIKVRSINQDDIDKVTNMTTDEQRKTVDSSYGTTYTPTNKNCPAIYVQEPGRTGGGTLDRNIQSSWYSNTTTFTSGKYTYYSYAISSYTTNAMYYALLTNMTASSTNGTSSNVRYWNASRCVELGGTYAWFRVFIVGGGSVDAHALYDSNGDAGGPSYAVRPMVEINLDFIAIGAIGTGMLSSPYSMAKK